jgi:hypothetical protein
MQDRKINGTYGVQTSDFAGPTKNSLRTFLDNLLTPVYQTEGHQEIYQNRTALHFLDLQGTNHLVMTCFSMNVDHDSQKY